MAVVKKPRQWTSAPARQGAAPLLPYRPPGAGSYVVGGNVVDVGGRAPVVSTGITRRPVPGQRTVGPPVGPGPGGTGGTPAPAPTDGGFPWQSILDQMDARERAMYEDRKRRAREDALAYMQALTGFGQALQGNAAEQWGNVIKAYGRAGDTSTAFQNALASNYGQGLTDANRQIAADFAAIGQGGAPNIRDDAAALEQIQTVGGARPGETMGLVGRAWGSYGETRPGSLGFMTQQNLMQAEREALKGESDIETEMQAALADNPEQAIKIWQTMEEWQNSKTEAEAKTKQQEFENQLAAAKEQREAKAFELQVQKYNLSYGKELASQAEARSRTTGTVWAVNPKTGKLYNTGRPTESRRAATAREATAQASLAERQAHNRVNEANAQQRLGLSDAQLKIAQQREARLAKGTKKGGYSATKRQGFRGDTLKALAFYESGGAKDKDGKPTNKDPFTGQDMQKTAAGNVRPQDVIKYAMTQGVPYSIAVSVVQNQARTKYKNDPAWQATLNWTK